MSKAQTNVYTHTRTQSRNRCNASCNADRSAGRKNEGRDIFARCQPSRFRPHHAGYDGDLRLALSARGHSCFATSLPAPSERQPNREERPDRRLRADRPNFFRPGIFPFSAIKRRDRLRRREFFRLEFCADESSTHRPHQERQREIPRRKSERADSNRSSDIVGLRPRS